MSVKFFGQYLIDEGEIDASHVRLALHLMDAENPTIGQLAVENGMMDDAAVTRVHVEQRRRDLPFGDLAVEMGLLEREQLVEILKHQLGCRLPIGEALVRLGHLDSDRLGVLLDAFKADQSRYEITDALLPDGLASRRVARHVVDLLPRFLRRVAGIHAKVGDVGVLESLPSFVEVRVSLPMQGPRGVDVALVSDLDFAEALAGASAGLSSADLDAGLIADGVGEFLNVLCGNAASIAARAGQQLELGPPDYDAEISDGWLVDLAVGTGCAALVLSTS
jgi:CheY-specific phosphatase CheX